MFKYVFAGGLWNFIFRMNDVTFATTFKGHAQMHLWQCHRAARYYIFVHSYTTYNSIVNFPESPWLQHLEVRTVLPTDICTVADWTCRPLTQVQLAGMLKEVSDEFLAAHLPDTCGVTMIFAPSRDVSVAMVEEYVAMAKLVTQTYPEFFMGFDLVGTGFF